MNPHLKLLAAIMLAAMLPPSLASAQDGNVAIAAYLPPGETADPGAPPQTMQIAPTAYTQQELEQMLAPVALYPDSLLSQIMMAATYPLEVVEAARWSRANSSLQGDDAVRAVDGQDWDPSVKSLAAFPQVLAQLDQNLKWTERLGNAFLAQQAQVMQTVQDLRQKAQSTGNLASNQQVRVEQQAGAIMVDPVDPQAVYVPYYDPAVVYGPVWSPAYPPAYFAPPYGYYPQPGLFWGPAIFVSAGFFFGAFDWHRHGVTIVNTRPYYFHPGRGSGPRFSGPGGMWQHDPAHRRGVAYRDETLRQQFGRPASAVGRPGAAPGRPAAATAERRQRVQPVPGQGQRPPGIAQQGQGAPAQARPAERPQQERPNQERQERQERPEGNRSQSRPNTSFYGGAPMVRYAQVRSFDAPRFVAAAHYSYAPLSYSAPRAPATVAPHYSAAHFGGGGGSHGAGGGGGHSGGGGRHR